MPCYHPIAAYRRDDGSVVVGGKVPERFRLAEHRGRVEGFEVPCGQCIGCRLERSRQWAVRCVHEAQLWPTNCFLTLTYDDAHLPPGRSLHYPHFQAFMKRLRKFSGSRVRFFACGEYGDKYARPHYHACIFNYQFPDQVFYKRTSSGEILSRSAHLDRLWGFGLCSSGAVTFESAAYVARYVCDKVNGALAERHYEWTDPETGEIFDRVPEFVHMSLKPGIGAEWFKRFRSDVYPHDYVVARGVEANPPRYYDKLLKRLDPDLVACLKVSRELKARVHMADNTDSRLAVKEQVSRSRLSIFGRDLGE